MQSLKALGLNTRSDAVRLPPLYVNLRLGVGRGLRPLVNRRSTQLFLDGCSAISAVLSAYVLRFDGNVSAEFIGFMWLWTAVFAVAWPSMLAIRGGYRSTWQHFGINDLRRMVLRALPLCAFLLIVRALTPGRGVIPYTVILLLIGLTLFFSASLRLLRRFDHESMRWLKTRDNTILIGTEETVAGAVRQLRSGGGIHVVGILSPSDNLGGRNIDGIPVLGSPEDLEAIILAKTIKVVIFSSAELACIPAVLGVTSALNILVKILPSADDLLSNKVQVSKNLQVQDLALSQSEQQAFLDPKVDHCLYDKVVLITGAGGSIGSELSRQVAGMRVRRLLLLDQDENSIFDLMNELQGCQAATPVIADIRDEDAINRLFAQHKPQVILHAAAYKHVPMMELNPCEAVLNNVGGTRVLAEASVRHECERMVMISSDKAVQPSSVMGATKRTAELLIQNLCTFHGNQGTRFACVRFGNVLGSRGSVLPTFLRQIAHGGPVTVTNHEMTRYFMTIPQAVGLVLQAATLADSGDVFMLDMGDPITIMSLAENVIRSSGLVLDQDIRIAITGSRPGEKLHERLWSEHARVISTQFSEIYKVECPALHENLFSLCERLEHAARNRDLQAVHALFLELPIEYRTDKANAPNPLEEDYPTTPLSEKEHQTFNLHLGRSRLA